VIVSLFARASLTVVMVEASAAADAELPRCRNCGASAPGAYCPSCGQETRTRAPTFIAFIREAGGLRNGHFVGVLRGAVIVWMLVYLVWSQHVVYRGSWLAIAARSLVMLFFYMIMFALVMAGRAGGSAPLIASIGGHRLCSVGAVPILERNSRKCENGTCSPGLEKTFPSYSNGTRLPARGGRF
jgi:hypothetical protein